MRTKLISPEHKLFFDDEIVNFIEKNKSDAKQPNQIIAIIGASETQYRTIYLEDYESINELDNLLRKKFGMINRLAERPPFRNYSAIYAFPHDDEDFDDDDDWI